MHPSWRVIKHVISLGIFIRKVWAYFSIYISRVAACIIDIIVATCSFSISLYLWYKYYYNDIIDLSALINHYPLFLDLIACWIISSYCINLYKKYYLSYGRSFVTGMVTLLLSAASTYFIGIFAYSRAVLILTLCFTSIFTSTWRIGLQLLYRYRKITFPIKATLFSRKAFIMGTSDESMRIGHLLSNNPTAHFIIAGYIDDYNFSSTNKFRGRLDDIYMLTKKYHINEIIIPEDWGSIKKLIDLINKLKHLKINIKLFEYIFNKI